MTQFQAVLGGIPEALEGHRIAPGGAPSPHQSVAENVMLGIEPTRLGFIRRRELESRAAEHLAAVGWTDDVRSPLSDYSVVDCRRVQLARAVAVARLRGEPAVLIDDTGEELSESETVRWQHAVSLAAERIPIVIALTTLDELNRGVESVLVNHEGRVSGPFDPTDAVAIASALGIAAAQPAAPARVPGDVLLEVRQLHVMHPVQRDRVMFDDVSFTARAGAVIGISGAHAHELLASLSGRGYGEITAGGVFASGADISGLTRDACAERGVVFTTEHPLTYEVGFVGGVPSRVSAERLRTLARTGMIDAAREYRPVTTASLLQAVGVGRPPSRDQFDGMLDALVTGPARIVLIAEPLLGLGPDERAERITMIDRLASAGKAVVVSGDAVDVAAIADEALLVVHGRIRAALTGSDVTSAGIAQGLLL
ncbi:hypothetical protein [Paramicrobacterium agarici]|uniref:ABC-type sugar transport system ATPase subunit n=1 Tax=Paramicrobacterium agarici TaxID=630514 RepID=A0A2A9DR18_9MICO|nr:hypothetical protein [Microbacterium agarici]PFG29138.1 ABC-type sugar transport system ATPase subunit [Microbacterium agarici]